MALNKSDLDQIDKSLDKRLNRQKKDILEQVDHKLNNQKEGILERVDYRLREQKEDMLEEIDEKLTKLKSDFFEKIDPILKEVVIAREESPLVENRLEALEEIHPKGKHALSP